jgi:hypothetical protein
VRELFYVKEREGWGKEMMTGLTNKKHGKATEEKGKEIKTRKE